MKGDHLSIRVSDNIQIKLNEKEAMSLKTIVRCGRYDSEVELGVVSENVASILKDTFNAIKQGDQKEMGATYYGKAKNRIHQSHTENNTKLLT